jgi:hypothetical protein
MKTEKKETKETKERYSETSEDIISAFMNIVRKKNGSSELKYDFISDSKQKTLINLKKLNPLDSFILKKDIRVVVNEEMYDAFDDESINLLLEEEIDKIVVTMDNGKITIRKYDLSTFSGILSKYGIEAVSRAKQVEVLTFEQAADMETGFTK